MTEMIPDYICPADFICPEIHNAITNLGFTFKGHFQNPSHNGVFYRKEGKFNIGRIIVIEPNPTNKNCHSWTKGDGELRSKIKVWNTNAGFLRALKNHSEFFGTY